MHAIAMFAKQTLLSIVAVLIVFVLFGHSAFALFGLIWLVFEFLPASNVFFYVGLCVLPFLIFYDVWLFFFLKKTSCLLLVRSLIPSHLHIILLFN